jgi:HD-GYP domain-containing protein (c-di-GMP phosphodiesterase class II)
MFNIVVTDSIKKDDVRFFKITQSVYVFCFFFHTLLIFIFNYFEVFEMVLFNIFVSLPLFLIAFSLNNKGYLSLAFMIASLVLILHQTLSIYYIGWDAGAQYYFIFIAVFMFFNHEWDMKSQILFVSLITVIYIMAYTFFRTESIYTLEAFIYTFVNIFMIVLTTASIALLLNYFVKGANRSEQELEKLVKERTYELEQSQRDAISMLGEAGHHNDYNTGVHIWRMADYAALLAEHCGYKSKEVELIKLAAPMHDTGKIGISDYILQKPMKLKEDEWEIMKTHCAVGYKILSKSETPLFQLAASIALNHHEKWDGSGYPRSLKGKTIPKEARVVAIADVFDALTMKRDYKDPWSVEDTFAFLQENSGKHFDPDLVDIFISLEDEILKLKDYWEIREIKEETRA